MQIIGGVTDAEVAADLLTSQDYKQFANTFGTAGMEVGTCPMPSSTAACRCTR